MAKPDLQNPSGLVRGAWGALIANCKIHIANCKLSPNGKIRCGTQCFSAVVIQAVRRLRFALILHFAFCNVNFAICILHFAMSAILRLSLISKPRGLLSELACGIECRSACLITFRRISRGSSHAGHHGRGPSFHASRAVAITIVVVRRRGPGPGDRRGGPAADQLRSRNCPRIQSFVLGRRRRPRPSREPCR